MIAENIHSSDSSEPEKIKTDAKTPEPEPMEEIKKMKLEKAIELAKQSVFAAVDGTGPSEPDESILNILWDAHWLHTQWKKYVERYRKRLAAHQALTVTVPELEAKAQKAKQLADGAKAFMTLPLANMAMAYLMEMLELPPDATLFHLANATASYEYKKLMPLEQKVFAARNMISNTSNEAKQYLHQTASEESKTKEREVINKIARLDNQITARREVVEIDDAIAKATEKAEAYSRGEFPSNITRTPAEYYQRARRDLEVLRQQAEGKSQAIQDNERDRKEIERLQKQLPTIREEMLVPANMSWSDDVGKPSTDLGSALASIASFNAGFGP